MDIILTTKCNRKCSGCCYLFNKYTEGELLDADHIIENINKITPAIVQEDIISIIGGETFLYPDLVKIVNHVKQIPVSQYNIFTNGTILPDYIEELCKAVDNRFHFIIGNYGNPDVMSKLCEIFSKYNVSHVIRPEDDDWIEHGDFIKHNEPKDHFCDFRYLTLMKDRVYACGRFAQAVNLGLIPIEDLADNEYVDINDPQLLEKLTIMYEESFDTFSPTCDYCLRGSKKSIAITQGD